MCPLTPPFSEKGNKIVIITSIYHITFSLLISPLALSLVTSPTVCLSHEKTLPTPSTIYRG
jgi:hypothetical protein